MKTVDEKCVEHKSATIGSACASGAERGNAFADPRQQPFAVSDDVAFGFAAAVVQGKPETATCGACYLLTFTSGPVQGKKLVVQVTNTGFDLGADHFDLQIPGGGFGHFKEGCPAQFPQTPATNWGKDYGGVDAADQCAGLPKEVREGCEWRFSWFKNADNPEAEYEEVMCPQPIIDLSGSYRDYSVNNRY
jgi:hypothetical protein